MPRTLGWKTLVTIAWCTTFGSATIAGFGIATAQAPPHDPLISVLGSGDGLSVLVRAGDARIVIASGTDAGAFGNALGRGSPWGPRRIDLLLLSPNPNSLPVTTTAIENLDPRQTSLLGPSWGASRPVLQGVPVLPSPSRITLPDDVVVQLEWAIDPTGEPETMRWKLIVSHQSTRIAMIPDGSSASLLDEMEFAQGLIVLGSGVEHFLESASTPLVVTSASTISGKSLRSAADTSTGALWGARIFPGNSIDLTMTGNGLSVPRDQAQPLRSAEPVGSPGAIP